MIEELTSASGLTSRMGGQEMILTVHLTIRKVVNGAMQKKIGNVHPKIYWKIRIQIRAEPEITARCCTISGQSAYLI